MDLQLLPRPPKPGLYAATGNGALLPWALRALAVTFTPQHRIVWIDAANQFNAHWVAQSGRAYHKNSKDVLRAFKYARPFTAFQLEAMVNQKLVSAMHKYQALFAVIASPLWLYEEADDQYATQHSFDLLTSGLRQLSKHLAILLLIPDPKPTPYYHRLIRMADQVVEPPLSLR
jgi:hypothetical protein